MRKTLSAALLALLLPAALAAQSLREQTRAVRPESPKYIISVNPFLPLFGYFQGEFEKRLNANVSFAIAGSHVEWDDDRYTNLDAKLRLYPQERALQGLGLAASLGVANVRRTAFENCVVPIDGVCDVTTTVRNTGAPTFAVEGQYQWLLGSKRATAVTTGFGVKRYFVSRENFGGDRVRPTIKLAIGYAF
jgi:hypothetical protein